MRPIANRWAVPISVACGLLAVPVGLIIVCGLGFAIGRFIVTPYGRYALYVFFASLCVSAAIAVMSMVHAILSGKS